MRMAAPALIVSAMALSVVAMSGSAANTADKRIFKIDSLIASVQHQMLVVQASGATQGGGWSGAKLKLIRNPDAHGPAAHALMFDFVATPPPAGSAAVEGLVPVSAKISIRLRTAQSSVEALAEANQMTTQILHQ